MKTMTMLGALLVLAVAAGCSPRDEDEAGPAQKAGKAIDDAGDKVARELRAPLEKADEAAKRVAERADEAREKIKDATDEAGRGLQKAGTVVGEKVERAGEKMQESAR